MYPIRIFPYFHRAATNHVATHTVLAYHLPCKRFSGDRPLPEQSREDIMRSIVIAAALFAVSTPAFAEDAAPVAAAVQAKNGAMLRDAAGLRLGKVSRVLTDGSVQIIYDQNFVVVPGATLSMVDNNLVTSLSKREVARLR